MTSPDRVKLISWTAPPAFIHVEQTITITDPANTLFVNQYRNDCALSEGTSPHLGEPGSGTSGCVVLIGFDCCQPIDDVVVARFWLVVVFEVLPLGVSYFLSCRVGGYFVARWNVGTQASCFDAAFGYRRPPRCACTARVLKVGSRWHGCKRSCWEIDIFVCFQKKNRAPLVTAAEGPFPPPTRSRRRLPSRISESTSSRPRPLWLGPRTAPD